MTGRAGASADGPEQREDAGPWADAVIVAAGASSRMAGRDKIFTAIGGRPLIAWTVDAVAAAPAVRRVVLVVAADRLPLESFERWRHEKVAAVLAGGERRQDSVAAGIRWLDDHPDRAGIDEAPGRRVILVHDGARPLVDPGLIGAVASTAQAEGAAIPVVPIAETVKRVADTRIVETIDRSTLAVAQTPQGIRRDVLALAWAAFPPDGPRAFTDEASLLEACRIPVHAIPGDAANLKVTLPGDIERVTAALAPARERVGLGRDLHPFGPGEPLLLGGIAIAAAPRLHGHSDGDVVLHAVADALLGAARLGDLGAMFPADQRTPRGVDSAELLTTVVARLASAGLRPAGIDATIVAGRPRLAGYLPAMKERVATLLGLEPSAVNIKASTGNLAGAEGAGRAIAADVIATVTELDRPGAPMPR